MQHLLRRFGHMLRSVPLIGGGLGGIRFARRPQGRRVIRPEVSQDHSDGQAQIGTGMNKAIESLTSRLDEISQTLTQRIEFLRQEIFFEIRALTRADFISAAGTPVSAQVLSQARIDALKRQGELRLNIGCGHKPDPDRINIDVRELPGVDVIAPADMLPFGPGEVREIYSSHLLEHFPLEALRRSLLPAWVGLLASGGELRAVVPDSQAMIQSYVDGGMDFATLCLVTFGGQEYSGDFHHTMFTPASLVALLREAGLTGVHIEAQGRRNGLCLECVVVGSKP